jgi:hypothetical protein
MNRSNATSVVDGVSGVAITAGAFLVDVAVGLIVFGLLGLALSWRLTR